jgi:hypothetical protein
MGLETSWRDPLAIKRIIDSGGYGSNNPFLFIIFVPLVRPSLQTVDVDWLIPNYLGDQYCVPGLTNLEYRTPADRKGENSAFRDGNMGRS